jgi:hypothetical protein
MFSLGFSRDGLSWSLSPTPAYTKTVQLVGGGAVQLNRREEPKLLIEGGTGAGPPRRRATMLFNAACPRTSPHVCGEVLSVPLEPIDIWEPEITQR